MSATFDLRQSLLSDQEQVIWESMGLARDAQIIEQAALLRKMLELPYGSFPTPLLLDPTQTAINWLAEYLSAHEVACETTTQNNERFSYTLELAVRFGKVLLVQDCQQLRPPLLQLLAQRVHVKFNKRQLAVGAKMVDLHERFQLVLCSKTHKLSIDAESRAQLTIMPFTVTAVGLCDQLMSQAIVLKNPQLEQQRVELLKQEGVLLKQRHELEDKLLEELSAAQGDILKNAQLLETLNEVKQSSSHIDQSLQQSAQLKQTLLADYTPLRALCDKAAHFYVGLNATYELSAHVYMQLFLRALDAYDEQDARRGNTQIYAQLVRHAFQYLARATERGAHLTLALYICRHAYPELIPDAEWELFVTNFLGSAEPSGRTLLPLPQGVSNEAALKLQTLVMQLPQLEAQLQLHRQQAWLSFIEHQAPELPCELQSSFQRVLLVQILRPDLITAQLRRCSAELLGISPDSIVQPSVEQLATESSADKPILMITQAECDPATEIRSVAWQRAGGQQGYSEFSIGRGLERRALAAISSAAAAGNWICIKNVHLVPAWLELLERELASLRKAENFRLWLVCESTRGFSEAVMYKFVKVLYEFPSGLKHKVRRLIQNYITAMAVDQRLATPHTEARLLKMRIVLFVATAVLQERRQFIPQGWSRYYEFGDADLRAALDLLLWLDATLSSGRCDWTLMQRLCEHVAYGGRISNARDLSVLQRYLAQFCQAEVLSNRWSPLQTQVVVPTSAHMQDYLNAVAKFADRDEPEMFKLSPQAQRSRDIETSKQIIRDLRAAHYLRQSAESKEHSGALEQPQTEQKLEKQIKPLLLLWRKLAGKCNVLQTAEQLEQTPAQTNPWAVFVVSELKTAARCFQHVHQTLAQLHNWLKDAQARHDLDLELLQQLSENQTPNSWRRLWQGPQAAVDYMKALMVRTQAADERFHTQLHDEFTQHVDFSTLFHCETFLCALKLVNAHKLQISCKDLQLESFVERPQLDEGTACMVTLAPLKVDSFLFTFFYRWGDVRTTLHATLLLQTSLSDTLTFPILAIKYSSAATRHTTPQIVQHFLSLLIY